MALTVLVTGATSGFGAAMARRFVADGHRVIAAGRRAERLDALAAELGAALLAAPLDVTRAVLPGMVARDAGTIINLGSVAGTYPYPGGHVYGATKAFVEQFSLNLRADLVGKNIRVTSLEPGLVGGSEFSNVRLRDNAKAAKVYEGTDPLTPEDIAEAAAWIVALPPRVNINRLELMPTCQASGNFAVKRQG